MTDTQDRLTARPDGDRRRHQARLAKARRQRQRRRARRRRRLRWMRVLLSLRFWTRTAIVFVFVLAVGFWAKFAVVYDIPDYARQGVLTGVRAYVTVKPWWFGPPLFDLGDYGPRDAGAGDWGANPWRWMVTQLGRYQDVVVHPQIVWVDKAS
ncbi:hypothetical protein [Alicyclobacillus sp.]|uniref:hypothetical protein n=1 Tax=Alicyclobacillus sp. TaxID=61169 RepID=UPI0025BF96D0|nr:hypothetical protein [Alicyclobacillus sp.]MCL6516025.1 hypothetical protein [Alicyclobacillus sp.]